MEWIILVTSVLGMLYAVYHIYIVLVGSLKKPAKIPYAKAVKRIAVVIAARNEARVVGNLVDSLNRQRYPHDLYDVYVVPNNCTDDTEAVAREAGALILTCRDNVRSKGEVLHETFNKLLDDPKNYDGYVIFDADNIADGDFLQAVNNALCAGYQVGQAYRDSKNPNDSWVAGCTSIFFWFMNRLFNQSRAALGMSSPLNGTGILIGADFLRCNGYNTTALTEDLEYTAQCALAGEKIAWMRDAVTYDEQPIKFKDSFTQRRRWAAGTLQCFVRYAKPLYKKAGKSMVCLDMALHFTGVIMQVISLVPGFLTAILIVQGAILDPAAGLPKALWALGIAVAGCLVSGICFGFIVCALEHKLSRARIIDMTMMGWYMVSWFITNLLGYLLPTPKWKEIPHVSEVDIAHCEARDNDMPFQQKETESL